MGLHRIAKSIQYTRSIFKYAYDAGLIDRPIRFGPGFARPSKKNFRLAKAQQIVQLFTADEIRRMLEAATLPMRAMVLLAINCAYGNTDCGTLPMSAVHLDAGWIDHARPKTGLARRCPLWPETIAALKAWLAARPTPKDEGDIGLVFVTKRGLSWAKDTTDNPVAKEMRKLMKKLELDGGRGFYALRHTHRTIADAVCDQRASDFIMGHFDPTMSAHYVERVGDERLRRVVEYVRGWLFRVG
jgi:integrase